MGEFKNLVGALVVFCCLCIFTDIIVLATFLPRKSCLAYREFKGGAGEMTYCIIRPEDDNLEVSFYHGKDNYKRNDSTFYLLAPPLSVYRKTREIAASFKDEDYKNYHYFFKNDYIKGKVRCVGECTVRVVLDKNTCSKSWDNSILNISRIPLLSVTGRSRKCHYNTQTIFQEEGSGTIAFQAEIPVEGPAYVSVTNGLVSSPTGRIQYTVSQVRFNTSNAIKKCNSYECSFDDLISEKRNFSYVGVNIFSDTMQGEYEIEMNYLPDKAYNEWVAIGCSIGTGVVILATLILVIVSFVKE